LCCYLLLLLCGEYNKGNWGSQTFGKKKPQQNARANRGRTREINNDNNGAPSSVNTYF